MSAIQQLLTEHLDIWTAADTGPKSSRGRSSANAASVYGIRKLRELILELAVRGKLVPQDDRDEPASEMLKRMQAEKVKLIGEGKLKKEDIPAVITEEEKPFEIPQGWAWVRLGQATEVLDSLRRPVTKQDREPGPYPYYGASGIVDFVSNYIFDEPLVLVGEDGAKWGCGDNTAFLISGKTWVNNHAHVLRPFRATLTDRFLVCALNAMDLGPFITGMTVPKLNQARLVSIVLPLPSMAEQHRIVAKVDELMALCDQLESKHNNATEAHEKLVSHLLDTLIQSQSAEDLSANWQRIATHFDVLFTTEASIDALKQTLLQLAVMGKLVPQDPNDEPASELLKRIQAEKARLVKSGKGKNEDLVLEVSDKEGPFELRAGWEWARFGDVALIERGGSPRPIKDYITNNKDGLNWIKISDTDQGGKYITSTNEKIRKEGLSKTRMVYPGDFLLTNSMSFGRPYITKIEGCIHDGWLRISPPDSIDKDYLYYLLSSPYIRTVFVAAAAGAVVMNLNADKVRDVLIPLPSVAEQYRIVAKVDELMALCDQLKSRLTEASQLQQALADVLVENATTAKALAS